jgi:hypothetical protein
MGSMFKRFGGRMTKQCKRTKYLISVDPHDSQCLLLQGQEVWPEDEFASEPKSMNEIIVNAANYAPTADIRNGGYHYSAMDKPLWVEPRHPNPRLDDEKG